MIRTKPKLSISFLARIFNREAHQLTKFCLQIGIEVNISTLDIFLRTLI